MQITRFTTIVVFSAGAAAQSPLASPYGTFSHAYDALRLQPCLAGGTFQAIPALNDTHAEQTWAALFNADPQSWLWGTSKANRTTGIFLCGYLDVPLDYTNKSDGRIARLAVVKCQVSGLALSSGGYSNSSTVGKKSARTLLMSPGGPGGSGVAVASGLAQDIPSRLSDGHFDFLA
jgi:hypothetical protein